MGSFIKGSVVILPFPFSDLSDSKRRPALVLVDLQGDDLICCMITSQNNRNRNSLPLKNEHFKTGTLNRDSNIRPDRIFTADSKIILRKTDQLEDSKIDAVIDRVVNILKG
jgi:mRNA interferase MazF